MDKLLRCELCSALWGKGSNGAIRARAKARLGALAAIAALALALPAVGVAKHERPNAPANPPVEPIGFDFLSNWVEFE